jgi:asparagine synthase (glutamine-hydrolysing)
MCGISGLLFNPGDERDPQAGVRSMNAALVHRGPDDSGQWVDRDAGVALGHRRLSILDLSAAGHQPMRSGSDRYVLVFNGEIYNHGDLRVALGDVAAWRGHSDTETLLAGFERWGVRGTLERAIGMFAIAVWDRSTRRLLLARDRMGEKPLYFGWSGRRFVFASELGAIRALEGFDAPVDRDVLALYLRHGFVPAPWSIHRGLYKLLPGTILEVAPDAVRRDCWPGESGPAVPLTTDGLSLTRYWSLADAQRAADTAPFEGDEEEAVDQLDTLLRDAVGRQMVADVPLGAFLSGGVDSSAIVGLMQAQSARPVRTFTIGFGERGYDESAHAAAVASHLGTAHESVALTAADALAVIPEIASVYDEPFADVSQLPTLLLCRMARREVTVALSGDGGDELFGGYNRHLWAQTMQRRLRPLPGPLRVGLGAALAAASPDAWDRVHRRLEPLLPRRLRIAQPGVKLHKLARRLRAADDCGRYAATISHGDEAAFALGDRDAGLSLLADVAADPGASMRADQATMFGDALVYLPDDVLVKVDRAAMHASLETRVPFLDHRVVELAMRLPMSMKIRNGRGKHVLRRVLDRYVPATIIERPKMGFGVPIGGWLRGPLRPWANNLLDEGRLRSAGFERPEALTGLWRQHLAGERDAQASLWSVLMFLVWRERTGLGYRATVHEVER